MRKLLEFGGGDVERCGFILRNNTVVETKNVSGNPNESFMIDAKDILAHVDDAFATWHTHPTTDSRLSGTDYLTFLNWPHLTHYIVGTDGVRAYQVKDGAIFEVGNA